MSKERNRSNLRHALTLVVFCPKWWIHYDSVKLFGVRLWLQTTHVTLDQIHVRNLKLLCVSSEYVQSVIVNIEADAQTAERRKKDRYSAENRLQ